MKTMAPKFADQRSVRLNNTHAHQDSVNIRKNIITVIGLVVVLFLLINSKQASSSTSVTSNNIEVAAPVLSNEPSASKTESAKKESAPKNKPGENTNAFVPLETSKKEEKRIIAAAKISKFSIKKQQENEEYLQDNDIKNVDIINELSQVTDMNVYHFKKSSFQLQGDSEEVKLNNSIQKLVDAPDSWNKIIILGFADSRGQKINNVKLGMKRAESLKALLVSKGISPDKIAVASFGSDLPIASNNTDEGREHNRRAELNVLGNGALTDVPVSQ